MVHVHNSLENAGNGDDIDNDHDNDDNHGKESSGMALWQFWLSLDKNQKVFINVNKYSYSNKK